MVTVEPPGEVGVWMMTDMITEGDDVVVRAAVVGVLDVVVVLEVVVVDDVLVELEDVVELDEGRVIEELEDEVSEEDISVVVLELFDAIVKPRYFRSRRGLLSPGSRIKLCDEESRSAVRASAVMFRVQGRRVLTVSVSLRWCPSTGWDVVRIRMSRMKESVREGAVVS